MNVNFIVKHFNAKRVDDPIYGQYFILPARMVTDDTFNSFIKALPNRCACGFEWLPGESTLHRCEAYAG